jgi:hypothetical protein
MAKQKAIFNRFPSATQHKHPAALHPDERSCFVLSREQLSDFTVTTAGLPLKAAAKAVGRASAMQEA